MSEHPTYAPDSAAMPDDNILDPGALEGLREMSAGDGGAFFRELVEIFLQDTPARIAEIEAGLATGDSKALARAAHSIKGSSGNFGAARLSDAARQIEQLGRQEQFAQVPAEMLRLRSEYDRVEAALKLELSRLK